ncbi:hypothetical protein [Rhodoferax sp. GW822-FHT02A01]|uniref:hypothetical protein n=1 Tax=Rhodoferax sp. GW822-FHT02A01 TaxID=3141537 RepID=UPI00315D87FE
MRSRDIFEHQVRSLVSLVRSWKARALGELEDVEADVLQDMVSLCSQSFDRGDEVWNAFAVPVAVHWRMRQECFFLAKRGQGPYLSELAAGIRQCTGAEKVLLDDAIYSAKALFAMSAHALHDHLQFLLLATPRLTKAPASIALRSCSEPPWRMAYFLGVEVTKPGGKRQLNEPGVQDAVQGCLHWGVDALTKSVGQDDLESAAPSKFEQGAFGTTVCHAPMYLLDAIQFGEKALPGYRLRQLLQEMAKEDKQATLYYAFNPVCFALDLLLKGRWLTSAMRWSLFASETVEDAQRQVRGAIAAAKTGLRCQLVSLELDALQEMSKKTALGIYSVRGL